MEICRSFYTADQLVAMNQYVMDEYRKKLSVYNFSQLTTIVENISCHICYMHLNDHESKK